MRPAPAGEYYAYVVDKFWVVVRIRDDGMILLRTRRGKEHLVEQSDPHLRAARWWHKFFWRHRFPATDGATDPSTQYVNAEHSKARPD